MVALGCLMLIVLPLLGLVVGGFLGGPDAALWGTLGGFALAAMICAISGYALVKAGRQR